LLIGIAGATALCFIVGVAFGPNPPSDKNDKARVAAYQRAFHRFLGYFSVLWFVSLPVGVVLSFAFVEPPLGRLLGFDGESSGSGSAVAPLAEWLLDFRWPGHPSPDTAWVWVLNGCTLIGGLSGAFYLLDLAGLNPFRRDRE
jgi:hypothetical protein